MSKSVDVKSLLIGGLLVLLVLACLGSLPWLPQECSGRFTVGTTDEAAFILDTATGQSWAYAMPSNTLEGIPSSEEFFSPKLDPNLHVAVR
ncbi:MAG: hypothetical protein ABFE01_11050 [Phycisphaerales bacterium]